jgi:hypothetical protein
MIAMTNCVKGLAVPGPPPGPWEASTKLAESKAAADVTATAKGECHFRGEAMMISRDEKLQKIRVRAYAGFERCHVNFGVQRVVARAFVAAAPVHQCSARSRDVFTSPTLF